jgi:lysophospholipase L1-like esterase
VRILRVVAALLLPWLVLEAGLRLAQWSPPDLRPRTSLFPSFPTFYEPDRDLGWRLKPNLDWKGRDLLAPFHTDAHGNRRNPFLAAEHLPSTVDVLGDSTTFGYGATDGRTFPATLQRLLNARRDGGRTVVIRNLGVPGYSAVEARLHAERDGHHAPVTLILVGFNDHFASVRPRLPSLWIRRASYACFRSLACSFLFDWATWRDPAAGPAPRAVPPSYVPEVPEGRYVAELRGAVQALRERGSEPILLVYPPLDASEEVIRGVSEHFHHPVDVVRANIDAHPRYQALTREVAQLERTALVELPPLFDAAGNHALHLDWVHPNEAGLGVIAGAVAEPVRSALAPSQARD